MWRCPPANGLNGRQNSDGDATDMRLSDVQVAHSAAVAAFNGNLVKVALSEGHVGIGVVWAYRPEGGSNGGSRITSVLKYDVLTNRDLSRFSSESELYSEFLLQCLRRPTFRLIAFADAWLDRVYSQLYSWQLRYTAPVASRLTTPPTPSDSPQARLSYATHSRQGISLR